MFKKSLLASLLCSLVAVNTQAHQLWITQDDNKGPARVYMGDADGEVDTGDDVAKLAETTQVFTKDRKQLAKLTVKNDHLEAAVSGNDDVYLFNDQVWKPRKNKEDKFQASILTSRAGRTATKPTQDFELVPVNANGDEFTLTFKGQPLANNSVSVVTPDKWKKTFKTDGAGRVSVPIKEKGRYVLIANHNLAAEANTVIAGQAVDKLSYTTTLSFIAK